MLAVSSLGVFMAFVDATIVNIAFPDIGRSFESTSVAGLSWVLNAYNIVFAAFLVAAGRIADLLGRRRIFLAGLVVFTVASGLCAIAPSAGTLVGARILQALGAAAMVPASLGLVLDAFPRDRRPHAVALLTSVGALAAGIGPSLGGLLVTASSWRLVFLVNLPVGVVAYWLSRRHLVESRAPGRRRMPDIAGALIFAVAVAALVLAVVQGDAWGWTSPAVIASSASAVVLGAVFAWRCTWHRAPLVDVSLLRIRTFTVANAASVLAAAGFYGYTLANVLFLTGVWRYSILEAGLAITPGPFVAAAVAGPTSRLAARVGYRVVLPVGGLLWGAAVLWFVWRVGPTPAYVAEWLPGMVLLGLGAGTLLPNLTAAAVNAAPGDAFATATGLNSVARQVGAALGVAVIVAVIGAPAPLEAPAAFDRAWLVAAACLLAAGVACVAVGRIAVDDATPGRPSLPDAARALLDGTSRPADPMPSARPPEPRVPLARDPAADHPETDAGFLSRVPVFAAVPAPLLEELAHQARAVRIGAGETLFELGDPAGAMYVVRAGRLEVLGAGGTVLRELGRGAALGELALLTGSPRSASVRAARASDLLAIEREQFDRLVEASPELARSLARVLAGQLQESRGAPPASRPLPVTIALVALDAGVPLAELAARLTTALGGHARVTRLDRDAAPPPGAGVAPAVAYGGLVDRAEAGNDAVLLVGGPVADDDPWTAFALQQADRILAFASGTMPADGSGHRPELVGCDLVAYGVAPGSRVLDGWVAALDPAGCHALHAGSALDAGIARLARRLRGRSVGVVLSGGGGRAFAHIGVIEELLAAGVTIDRVAGVSMGAFIGALLATGMDADEIDARCYDEWIRRRPLSDYTIPRHALIRGLRFETMLERTFGERAIEELERAFVCLSADLRTSEPVVHRHGSLRDHVGTSMCMPLLAPPQVRGRRLLIDGSLLDNLPVTTMAAQGEGPIIAVDVKASFERPEPARAPSTPRNGRTRIAGGGPPPPGLGETVTRVLLLASSKTSVAAERHADLVITPRTDGVGLLEFHQLDAAREAGRRAARDALAQAPPVIFPG